MTENSYEDPAFRRRLARKLAHSRVYEQETLAELAQLGLPWAEAFELLHDRSVAGMPLDQYRAARAIVRRRKQLRSRLYHRDMRQAPPISDLHPRPFDQTEQLLASGTDLFAALAWLAEQLAEHGEPPIVLPGHYDQALWDAVAATHNGAIGELSSYLSSLPESTVELPRAIHWGGTRGAVR